MRVELGGKCMRKSVIFWPSSIRLLLYHFQLEKGEFDTLACQDFLSLYPLDKYAETKYIKLKTKNQTPNSKFFFC